MAIVRLVLVPRPGYMSVFQGSSAHHERRVPRLRRLFFRYFALGMDVHWGCARVERALSVEACLPHGCTESVEPHTG